MEFSKGMDRFEVLVNGDEYSDGRNYLREGDHVTIFDVSRKPNRDDFPLKVLWEGEIKQDLFLKKRYKMSTVPDGLDVHAYVNFIKNGHLTVVSRKQ